MQEHNEKKPYNPEKNPPTNPWYSRFTGKGGSRKMRKSKGNQKSKRRFRKKSSRRKNYTLRK